LSLRLPRLRNGYFYVLAQRSQEINQSAYGEITGPISRQRGYLGLRDAKNLSGFRLGEATRPDEAVDLQGQPRFHQLLFRVGQSKIGKHIAATFSDFGLPGGFMFGLHFGARLSL
jgi:hypothetical protein